MKNKKLFYGLLILILVGAAIAEIALLTTPNPFISSSKSLPQPTLILPKEKFCGSSTYGKCTSDANCLAGGCSGQVCQSKDEEPIITTCEWEDCYDAGKFGLNCKCLNNQCQWAE